MESPSQENVNYDESRETPTETSDVEPSFSGKQNLINSLLNVFLGLIIFTPLIIPLTAGGKNKSLKKSKTKINVL